MSAPLRRRVPLTNQARDYLRSHPGPHRPIAVATALGENPQTVAMTLRYLAKRGEIDQQYVTTGSRSWAMYAHTGGTDAPTQDTRPAH